MRFAKGIPHLRTVVTTPSVNGRRKANGRGKARACVPTPGNIAIAHSPWGPSKMLCQSY